MQAYAERDGHDAELWAVTGLLHDADYERFPDMDDAEHGHPRTIMAELERRGAPAEMVRAIASHADYLGVEPESPMERTLVAVDELCGFLVACAQVRPEGIHGLTPKSVKKKLKQPSFAAAVSRDDVRAGRRAPRRRLRRARRVRHRRARGPGRRARPARPRRRAAVGFSTRPRARRVARSLARRPHRPDLLRFAPVPSAPRGTVCEHMFVAPASFVWHRIRRAAALLRAFALLEDPPVPRQSDGRTTATESDPALVPEPAHASLVAHLRDTHPHRVRLATPRLPRRPGVPPRPAACLTPVHPRAEAPLGERDRRGPQHSGTPTPPPAT